MDWEKFFHPTRFKLLLFIILFVIFTVRLYDRTDTLYINCPEIEPGGNCEVSGELYIRTGFPFATYHVNVSRAGFEHLFFYDMNFFVDLVIWYLVACTIDAAMRRYKLKTKVKGALIKFLRG